MNVSKIIKATWSGRKFTRTAPITQWDYGYLLQIEGVELPASYEIDFSNTRETGDALKVLGNENGAEIPPELIETGKDIYAFYYHIEDGFGKTVKTWQIPNQLRARRTSETPTPAQQSIIDQAISALNTAVEKTAQDVIDADASARASAESAQASGESALSASNSALSSGEYASNALGHAESASESATASAQSAERAQTSAQTASEKAAQASSAESSAALAAQTATAKAIEAAQIVEGVEGYAQSAEQSAQSAAASATTASTKASEASQSASTASTKATEATTAASATTAKNDAVSAKTAAQTAQTAAETAQEAAEDAAESVSASAAQIATNTADITDLKSGLSGMTTATAEDAGKALKAKTVTDGKVTEWEFGEAGGADPEVIEQAVTDWLDEHPEATTTVEDGSLTEVKFSDALKLSAINDYVTPEMFGAKGDGVTDDTQAIQNMFASGAINFVFDNKNYRVNCSLDAPANCYIRFYSTTLSLERAYDIRDYDYVIGFSGRTRTYGDLMVDANSSCNIGIKLKNIGGSSFDKISVRYARMWGVYLDPTGAGNNGFKFKSISASGCGSRVSAIASRQDGDTISLTNITGPELSGKSDAYIIDMLDNRFLQANFVVDDSGYTNADTVSRIAFKCKDNTGITLTEGDITSGSIDTNLGIPSDYTSKAVYIPVGGGICFRSTTSEGAFDIEGINVQNTHIGVYTQLSYGGRITSLSSEYVTLPIVTDITYALSIAYMYLESVGNYYQYKFNDERDRTILLCMNESTNINVDNPFVGTSRIAFYGANEILMRRQASGIGSIDLLSALHCASYLSNQKLSVRYINTSDAVLVVSEYSPQKIVWSSRYLTSGSAIKLDLIDLWGIKRNYFAPVDICFKLTAPSYGQILHIKLTDKLSTNGYSINGSIDNVLTIDGSVYNSFFKVNIMLFGKVFYVQAEAITGFVDNTQA